MVGRKAHESPDNLAFQGKIVPIIFSLICFKEVAAILSKQAGENPYNNIPKYPTGRMTVIVTSFQIQL